MQPLRPSPRLVGIERPGQDPFVSVLTLRGMKESESLPVGPDVADFFNDFPGIRFAGTH
jgi:hypothetical protein